MKLSQLEGRRVALWGWGREGRAAHAALRARGLAAPGGGSLPLTVFCAPAEAAQVQALGDAALTACTQVDAERLSGFDVVIKSPGISAYRDDLEAAQARGTRFVGGTGLWFSERPEASRVCVTGTKGKSTTSALLAHLLRAGGRRTALAGNIGLPLLELLDARADSWVVELSSYQTRDVADSGERPDVAVVTNVFPEHLDWHGSEQRYVEDKLSLLTGGRPRNAVLNAADPRLAALALPDSQLHWFNREDGWHARAGAIYRGGQRVLEATGLPLPGRHNLANLCAALAALDALGLDAAGLAEHARSFAPLPHRLQRLGERDGIAWINDSISTTPHASMAALDACGDSPVVILVGGHDRGLDWAPFAERMRARPPKAVITMGQNGPRIHALLAPLAGQGGFALSAASSLAEAVAQARAALADGGVVLLSPGAPSFGAWRDYTGRGREFAALAGFDPDAISAIPGMGVA